MAPQPRAYKSFYRPRPWIHSCGLCKQDHPIKTCREFLCLTPDERFEVVCQYYYCINCLACSHNRPNCPAKSSCHVCGERHNFLLHSASQVKDLRPQRPSRSQQRQQPTKKRSVSAKPPAQRQQQTAARSVSLHRPLQRQSLSQQRSVSFQRPGQRQAPARTRSPSSSRHQRQHAPTRSSNRKSRSPTRSTTSKAAERPKLTDKDFAMAPRPNVPFAHSKVFIPTVQIRIEMPNQGGAWHLCRGSLNFHATVSRISKSLQSKLKLETFNHGETRFAKFVIASRNSRKIWKKEITAIVTSDLPKKPYAGPIEANPAIDFPEDSLADPIPRSNTAIELELGADLYKTIFRNGCLETEVAGVFAQPTALGYVFVGVVEHM
ncbi:uncharacterized protein [Musca autumnalis]|uniref:uncharacterized protein n=1 Tax=Musca autumnalis TaxID=221902 RepID=UPI003CF1E459